MGYSVYPRGTVLLSSVILLCVYGYAGAECPAALALHSADSPDTWHYSYPRLASAPYTVSMRLNSMEYPLILYRPHIAPPFGFYLAEYDGAGWSEVTVDSSQYLSGGHLLLTQDDHPGVVYMDTPVRDLIYAWSDGSEWNYEIFWPDGGNGLDLALDSLDNLHICFTDYENNDVHYGYRDETGNWTFQELGHAGTFPVALALDGDCNPHTAWFDDYKVYHKWREDSVWHQESLP